MLAHMCEGLKELMPVKVSNVVANQGMVCIATRDFNAESASMDTGAVPEGAQPGVLADPAWQRGQGSHKVYLRRGLAAPGKALSPPPQ